MLTLAYVTSRKEPHFEWFFESLMSPPQTIPLGSISAYQIVVVDFYHGKRSKREMELLRFTHNLLHVPAKPTVWQGEHRLTSVDYFAKANALNTALCLAQDGWIICVDDLSVLMPEWLERVMEAMKRDNTITVGSYEKAFDLQVEDGILKSYTPDPHGIDHRTLIARNGPIICSGEWLYGSSLVAPVEALLNVNGWDENCDGMGYEDVVTGEVLKNAGCRFMYDPQMKTFESQELHQQPDRMLRMDKGISPNDKSHAILESARQRKWCPNYFGEEGIRGLRNRVLNGEPFPISKIPEHDWYDGRPLSEM